MPRMTDAEVQSFLTEPGHLLRLGTVSDAGMPSVVPIWFAAEDGALLFTPRARSAWLNDLHGNPQVCCTIDESASPMRKVIAQGTAREVHPVGADDEWRDVYRRITLRYVPESFGDAYLADTVDEPRALWALDLGDATVRTWRMPFKEHEDRLAVWAPKYYHDGRTS